MRQLDQSQIGRVLTGDPEALRHGPPVTAMLVQNTNPVSVAPEQDAVKRGFAREDLFTCVHEQFMTETALMADVVLPATMFLEHDDLYQAGGQQHIQLGPKLDRAAGRVPLQPRGDLRPGRAARRGAPRLRHDPARDDRPDAARFRLGHARGAGAGPLDRRPAAVPRRRTSSTASAIRTDNSGSSRTGRGCRSTNDGPMGPWASLPALPDHWEAIETPDEAHPFRLATSPARHFLNSTFTETPTSRAKERRPEVMIHPADAAARGIAEGDWVELGNARGAVQLRAKLFDGVRRGRADRGSRSGRTRCIPAGKGINTLTGADAVAPYGGAAFHDNRVALARIEPPAGFEWPEVRPVLEPAEA